MRCLAPLFLINLITGMMEFALPVKFSSAGLSVTMTAVLFSTVSLFSIVLDIPSGTWSDRVGRGRLIAYSMLVAALSALILYFAGSVAFFFVAAILFGVSYGLNWSPLLALVGDDDTEGHGKAFGRFFRLAYLGEGIAPLIVAFLALYLGASSPFLAVAVICLICFTLVYERPKHSAHASAFAAHLHYRDALRLFRRALPLNTFLVSTGFFVAFFWESVWFTQPLIGFYTHSLLDSALIVAAFAVPSILFSDLFGAYVDRLGEKRVYIGGAALAGVFFVLFYASSALWLKIAAIFVAAIGVQGVWIVMDVLTAKSHAQEERGQFFGILETVRDISYFISPLFIAAIYPFVGLTGVFAVNGAVALVLLMWGWVVFSEARFARVVPNRDG